jgi:hypothetical protein
LARIHTAIDNDNSITAKFAMKERFTTSMNAFLRHGNRTINSVVSKTVHKIGSHFDSLNFSDALPRFESFGKKTRGYAFSFTASLYDVFDENTASLTSSTNNTFGVDPLLCEIMRSATNEGHMADVIEYSLIKKSVYTDSPASYGALHKYLEKRKLDSSTSSSASAPPAKKAKAGVVTNVTLMVEDNPTIVVADFVDIQKSDKDADIVVTINNCAEDDSSSLLLLSVADLAAKSVSQSNDADRLVTRQLFQNESEFCEHNYHTVSTASLTPTQSSNILNTTTLSPPQNNDQNNNNNLSNNSTQKITAQATVAIKSFLELLLSDIKCNDEVLFLKLNTKNNIRKAKNLSFLKFIEENAQLDDVAFYELFCSSQYFTSLSCSLLIPFRLDDQFNITGDGYCFYRALFILLMREKSGFVLTAAELSELDKLLKVAGQEGEDLRAQFQDFFLRIELLFPDRIAKSKAATAGCTFSHLSTYLDQRFWGGNDSVPFLDYLCTAFSHNKDENKSLKGCWAKMFCSSVPGIVYGRETLDYNTVGDAYSLYDVLTILMRPHNWLLHKQVHFFVGDHPSVEVHLTSFAKCLSTMVNELRMRLIAAKGEDSNKSFISVYDRMVNGCSSVEDISWLCETRAALERQMSENNFVFGEAATEQSTTLSSTPPNKKMDSFLATPFGATQAQKIYISTINNTVITEFFYHDKCLIVFSGCCQRI